MPYNQSCIIILKPTAFFISFVSDQLSDLEQIDCIKTLSEPTAYTIPMCDNDELLLSQLERLYTAMFQYEVTRILGKSLASKVNADFVDFLCCFKFEVHSQPLLMEQSIEDCRQLIRVKPRTVSYDSQGLEDDVKSRTVPINPALKIEKKDMKPFLQRYCRPLLKADLIKKTAQMIQWPTLQSWQVFNRYFAVEVHTQLVHLH